MKVIIMGSEVPAIEVMWSTSTSAKPGQVDAEIVKCGENFEPGMSLELEGEDGENIFRGYVFEVQNNSETAIVTAYDQIRYMMYKDSYMIEGQSVGEILNMIAADMGLETGRVHGNLAAIDLAVVDKKLIDIVFQAMAIHEQKTGEKLFLWDEDGRINLEVCGELDSGILLSGESAMIEYRQTNSIDHDTYNKVKLAKYSKKKGLRTVKISDQSNQSDWGVLQYYKKVDEKMSEGEISSMANSILSQKNRIKQELVLNCVGNEKCRAGAGISWDLGLDAGLGSVSVSEGIISDARHVWSGANYTMMLDIEGV